VDRGEDPIKEFDVKERSVAAVLFVLLILGGRAYAVDGIAISTHRRGGGDGMGVNRSVYGDLVRHDIKNDKVVKSTVIYAGKARGARINDAGDKVVFLKLDGHLCVMNIDGTNVKELTNTKNHFTSGLDWPIGDWVYYSEQGSPSYKEDSQAKKTIRRVNVVTGEDELVGMTQYPVWQLTLSAQATKESGRFMVTSKLLDFSNPQPWTNPGGLSCGSVLSPSGRYVSEMGHTHADLHIRSWDPEAPNSNRNKLLEFHVNEWQPAPNDAREYFYRPEWSVNSDKWLVITHGSNFSCATDTNMVAYNWIDGRQIQITNNLIASGDNDETGDFWVAGVRSDFVPGGFEGEAPFTVNLASKKLQNRKWEWDYGDGTKETATEGKHTYKKPGTYRITARLGEQVLRQTVDVRRRKAPRGAVSVMDNLHLVVDFDEPMQAKDAEISLTSKVAVESFKFGPLNRRLHITLAAPVGAKDKLRLKGIYDRAQVPNRLANRKIKIPVPPWPTNRDGLKFLWETNGASNINFEPVGGIFQANALTTEGSVRYDRDGAMVLTGGVMFAPNAGYGAVKAVKTTKELTVEATITPANPWQGHRKNPSRIIACRPDHYLAWNNGFFTLHQEAKKLVLYINNGSQRFELCDLVDRAPNHIVATVTDKKVACYLNGKQVFETDKVKEINWRKNGYCAGVHFGCFMMVRGRHTPWQGKVEGVAVMSRAISAEDAAADFAAYARIVAARKKLPQFEVQARLAAKSITPKPADIPPYRDALVVNEYEVIKVTRGKYREKKVRVAEWGLLDLEPTQLSKAQIGSKVNIVLEKYTDHDELEGEVLSDTLDEDFDLDLYVDVSVRDPEPPRLVRITIKPREVWMPPGKKMDFSPILYDHYGNPIPGEVTWSVVPGGQINVGVGYGAGHWFHDAKKPGKGTVDAEGHFEGTGIGTVRVVATSVDRPEIKGAAVVGIGPYPAVNPSKHLPMRIGANSGGGDKFKGDIDRVRVYKRALTPEEIVDHLAGKGLEKKDDDLVGEWTFDELKDGAYPNVADPSKAVKGLPAKVVGEVQHVEEAGGGYVKLSGKGYLEVARDKRLDISKAVTLECWIRWNGGGGLVARQHVWMAGFNFRIPGHRMMLDGFRTSWEALEVGHKFPTDKWTHVVGVLGSAGAWQLYADGKLIRGYEAQTAIINGGD